MCVGLLVEHCWHDGPRPAPFDANDTAVLHQHCCYGDATRLVLLEATALRDHGPSGLAWVFAGVFRREERVA